MASTKKRDKYNVILVASHHGFFLTLKTLEKLKSGINKLIVVIPEDKIEKYGNMSGDMFENYLDLVKKETKAFKKTAKVFRANFDVFRRVSQTAEVLRNLNETGIWLQVSAGTVVNRLPTQRAYNDMQESCLMMSVNRCYESTHHLNMYNMLGMQDVKAHENQHTGSFLMNVDHVPEIILPDQFLISDAIIRGKFKQANPHAFSNREELVEMAFAGKQLLDHASRASDCWTADFWSMVMQPKVPLDFIYGYPLELYAAISECDGLIPAVTIQRIKVAVNECMSYPMLFRQAIS
jgi:hypothetical protein